MGACADVAFSKCRVILDLDRGKAHLVLAVTGAVRDDLVAVAIGIRQVRVGLAAFGHSTVDGAAINNLGVARRAEIVARGRPTLIVGCRDRKVATVAGAHAKGLATSLRTLRTTRARLLREVAAFTRERQRRRRRERPAASQAAEEGAKELLGLGGRWKHCRGRREHRT